MLSKIIISLLYLSYGTSLVSADGAIGCLFSSVCGHKEECVNDNLFGQCVPIAVATLSEVSDFAVETTDEQKKILSNFLRILAKSGYSWQDDETQCAIKWLIKSFASSERLEPPPCLSAFNEERPEQEQKRVSESLAHAFQSYVPQDGADESGHFIEKYPRAKLSVYPMSPISELSRYFASNNRPDNGRNSELVVTNDINSDDDADADEEEEVIIIPSTSIDENNEDDLTDSISDEDDDTVLIVPVSVGDEDDDENDEVDQVVPVVVDDRNDEDGEEVDDDEAVFNPEGRKEESSLRQFAPGLRTGGISAPIAIEIVSDDSDNDDNDDVENGDDDDSADDMMEQLAKQRLLENIVAEERLDRVLADASNQANIAKIAAMSDIKHRVALVSSDPRENDNKKPVSSADVKLVELNFAYVVTEPSINTEAAASAFLDCAINQIGGLSSSALIILDSVKGEVVFEVRDPTGKATATSVAKQIESNSDKIRAKCNRHVRSVGIGRSAHLAVRQQEEALAQTAEAQGTISRWSSSHAVIVALLVVVSVAIAGSVAVFVLLRLAIRKGTLKHALGNVRGKLSDWKSRRQYEDLCRESIAAKAGSAKSGSGLGEVVAGGARSHPTPPPSPPPWAEEPRPTDLDVSTAHVVLAYMEEHLKNRSRLEEEWRELCGYAPDRSDLSIAHLAENASKNRDMNVVPYDHNRVKLCSESNAFKSDYINASYIVDSDPRRPAYVATQAPVAETVADFWQLVWEQKSTLIVYLSQPNEPKAVRYWPEEGLTLYHRWQVGLVSEHAWNEDFIVRSLVLKDTATGDSRTVTQFHFLAWSADAVPKLCRSILAFRRKANRSYRPHASPIIIQSTNGGGRAGAYILLDMTLNHIAKGAREVDISASLEHLRDQRTGLVKSKEQFEFVLICVAEEIAAIVKSSREGSGNSSPE